MDYEKLVSKVIECVQGEGGGLFTTTEECAAVDMLCALRDRKRKEAEEIARLDS